MGPSEVEEEIKNWFASESIELQIHENEKAHFHMLFKFLQVQQDILSISQCLKMKFNSNK